MHEKYSYCEPPSRVIRRRVLAWTRARRPRDGGIPQAVLRVALLVLGVG